jgi:hypothetical protein
MAGEFGRRVHVMREAVDAGVVHTRRIVGIVSSAGARVGREVGDLVWDVRAITGVVRRTRRQENPLPEDVGVVDLAPPQFDSPPR